MDAHHVLSADRWRATLERGVHDADALRAQLAATPVRDRDAWLDLAFGLDAHFEDDRSLPPGCVPYLPCAVDALLRAVDDAAISSSDVVVDVGAGVGRAAALLHLLTGAEVVGLEIQPRLVGAARELARRLRLRDVSFIEGDARGLVERVAHANVFFLYCPFSGAALAELLTAIEPLAGSQPLRVCAVDVPLPPCPWLHREPTEALEVAVYRSAPSGRSEPSSRSPDPALGAERGGSPLPTTATVP